ncbi:glycosyltransferase family 2 protein [Ornithinibacillus salinisoli]|uniref:Glycosyltransferase family 2 protein n=1 Tax=Ornithinibacillus salinisoli TaxID=1848459 RepID=A0ABW4VXW3_9BACI
MKNIFKKILSFPMDWFLFTVLSENQRNFLSSLLSEKVKEKIKRLISGKKLIERDKLQKIKYHLYNLGMEKKGLDALEAFYENAKDPYLKRTAAWELVLWHANEHSEQGGRKALTYIPAASLKQKNMDERRRIAIIKAECLDLINKVQESKQTIDQMLSLDEHPDLFLARANLEDSIENKLKWINKALSYYNLTPISFSGKTVSVSYDDLSTEVLEPVENAEPKVSIILPAYNAETGIRTAINSLLAQTWQNFELLVVDDCSPDNTVKVVQEYAEKDSRVKLLNTPINSGPYVARNIALKEATGEFVTINDSDDWSHPQKIEIQVKHLLENEHIIANTSEHARLTEEIKLYRRGTPGKYIFPNMSSIMFRRKPVMEKLGFWDSVRFAADGEFKRRLLMEFGVQRYVDLQTGPLSLPRQSVSSLTGSSAFGYNGFFKGVRREYVESLEYYHNRADNLYYPYPQMKRVFPVPEPMWPQREEMPKGKRHFDVVIATDFRMFDMATLNEIKQGSKLHERIGLAQINHFNLALDNKTNEEYRSLIDGEKIQMLVYGEKIKCLKLIIINPVVLEDSQHYVPDIEPEEVSVVINCLPVQDGERYYHFNNSKQHLTTFFNSNSIWYPYNSSIRDELIEEYNEEINHIPLSNNEWK